jgi:hypothetical protein
MKDQKETQLFETSGTGQGPKPSQPVVVVMNEYHKFLEERANLRIDDLPNEARPGSLFSLPSADLPPIERQIGGKTIKYDRTIQDVNPQYSYRWCTAQDLRDMRDLAGFMPVKRGGFGSDKVPARHFDQDGFIHAGPEHVLCASKAAYAASVKQSYRDKFESQVKTYSQMNTSAEVVSPVNDANGNPVDVGVRRSSGAEMQTDFVDVENIGN